MKWIFAFFWLICAGFCNAQFANFAQRGDNQFVGGFFTNSAQIMSMSKANFFSTQTYNSNTFAIMWWMKNVAANGQRGFASQGASTQAYIFANGGGANSNLCNFILYATDGTTIQGRLQTNNNTVLKDLTAPHQIYVRVDITQSNPTNRFQLFLDGVDQVGNYDVATYPTNYIFQSSDPVKFGSSDFSQAGNSVVYEYAYWNGSTPNITNVFGFSANSKIVGVPLDLLTTAPTGLISWWRAGNTHGANSAPLRGYTNDEVNINPWTAGGNIRTTNAPPMQ